jgi:hypothetical protein
MTAMAFAPKLSVRPAVGFVVVMRAKLTMTTRPPWQEWFIVSRWGRDGDHLSIARTFVSVARARVAPIQLTPRQTALADLLRLPDASALPTFLLTQSRPDCTTMAGDFAPAEGYVRLFGSRSAPRLRAEGCCAGHDRRLAWRIEAVRAPWVGEFIEAPLSPDG